MIFYTKRAYLNELDGNRHIFLLINDTSTMKKNNLVYLSMAYVSEA